MQEVLSMGYFNRISNLQDYALKNYTEYFEMAVYSAVCFFLPFMIAHPQFVVGTLVNAMLITAALNIRGHKLLPVVVLPSIGVLTAGLIFGSLTVFLVYLLPFIWAGNVILIYTFKIMKLHMKKNYLAAMVAGAALKSGFLFLSALILFKLGLIPAIFLTAMGIIQLTTALSGGAAAYILHYTKKKLTT
jgi:hypothetical protein